LLNANNKSGYKQKKALDVWLNLPATHLWLFHFLNFGGTLASAVSPAEITFYFFF